MPRGRVCIKRAAVNIPVREKRREKCKVHRGCRARDAAIAIATVLGGYDRRREGGR